MPRTTTRTQPQPIGGKQPIIKSKIGSVIGDRMDKTVVVRIDSITTHPLYKKRVRKSKKFIVHDEENGAKVGDIVRITEGRPRSKTKSWQLTAIIRAAGSRAVVEDLEPELEQITGEPEE